MYDALIIGAGMSGLTAGIRLAMYDQKVCIVESHSVWGGLNSFYKKDGRSFDVGLHAMTNFVQKGTKKGPLPMVLRQLRLDVDDFGLLEQTHSLIKFPSATLRFTNELSDLVDEIHTHFPKHVDEFQRLCERVRTHDDGTLNPGFTSARRVLSETVSSPLLVNLILCPLLFYGSATERDMDWNQFVIMFKAVFFEGFCRPHRGVRVILKKLRETYLERGGELRMNSKVSRLESRAEGGVVAHLANGATIHTKKVLSSAGYAETLALLGLKENATEHLGRMSFVETIFCLDNQPRDMDINSSIVFFSQSDDFSYAKPDALVDTQSGIFCCPNNFKDDKPLPGTLRVTNIANYDLWKALRDRQDGSYEDAKQDVIQAQIEALEGIAPPFKDHVVYTDSFTPCTIERFTSHLGGAVYGATKKFPTGEFGPKDVFLCGTDQGYLGIVGAMLSGIIVANRHVLHGGN